MTYLRFGVSATFCLLLLCLTALAAAADDSYHYLCQFTLTEKGATLVSITKVESPLQKRRVAKTGLPFRFTLLNAKGTPLHSGDFQDPRRVTAEFVTPDGRQEHARATKREGSLLLALPPFEAGATLSVKHRTSRGTKAKAKVRYLPFAKIELPAPPSAGATPLIIPPNAK